MEYVPVPVLSGWLEYCLVTDVLCHSLTGLVDARHFQGSLGQDLDTDALRG
jgi:hypothetical protein